MKTIIVLEVIHRKPIPELANMVAGRAYNIDGVINAEPYVSPFATMEELLAQGFTPAEIALGIGREVTRS
jgi:hypothetical protein